MRVQLLALLERAFTETPKECLPTCASFWKRVSVLESPRMWECDCGREERWAVRVREKIARGIEAAIGVTREYLAAGMDSDEIDAAALAAFSEEIGRP